MTLFIPDMGSFQAGIKLTGALAAIIKATEGTDYTNPSYSAQASEARRVGAFQPAYHFLHQGYAAAQAGWAHVHAGPVPMMIDAEPTTGLGGKISRRSVAAQPLMHRTGNLLASRPGISDICGFTDAYRKLGGTVFWVYLPHWYWVELGSPSLKPLADRGLLLWSSDYTTYTDAGSGAGWQPYDKYLTPQMWQYSSSVSFGGVGDVDFSAFRGTFPGKEDPLSVAGCLAEFASLTLTGALPRPPAVVLPPVRNFRVIAVGDSTVRLQWDAPAGPSPFTVGWYQVTIRRHGQDLPSYPRTLEKGSNPENHQFGSLPLHELEPGEKLTAWCRAVDTPAQDHASPWQTAQFPN